MFAPPETDPLPGRASVPVRRVFSVSDRFYDSPPVVQAGNAAIGVWTVAGAWVAAQGLPEVPPIPKRVLYTWTTRPDHVAERLVGCGLWDPCRDGGGWWFVPNDRLYVFKAAPKWRESIPESLRARVYERDGHACLHCGDTENLSLDHIHPYSLGGPDSFDNLQTLCVPCNSRKGARV